jgi:CheY-like chemotaxis protein
MALRPILLAEDDENDIVIMECAFRKAHIANPLIVLRNGEQVVDYFVSLNAHVDEHATIPPLLLLDWKMPKMNGAEVLSWVRKHPSLNRLAVAVLTSSREVSDIRKAYQFHANSFLVKRNNIDELAEMLKCVHAYWLVWNESPDTLETSWQRAGKS